MTDNVPTLEQIDCLLRQEYGLSGIRMIGQILTGLIHLTYHIQTVDAEYAFQRLHPKLATEEILSDYQAVTGHLAASGFPCPVLFLTRRGGLSARDETGCRWRLSSWLAGMSHDSVTSLKMVREAAGLLGAFHERAAGLDYAFQSRHPLHDTRYHLARLEQTLSEHNQSPVYGQIAGLAGEVIERLQGLLLPELRLWVVHGDLKISNFLFDRAEQAIGLIDLDTCTHHTVLVDLGDAVRSWCRAGREDEESDFMLDRFESLVQGYAASAVKIQPEEKELIVQAGLLITYELAARFLTDVVEDEYFGWDTARYSSRPEHNLARARAMVYLARDMELKRSRMERAVKHHFVR
ncbi:phosphotransferase [bacterium]|nr:phosphotransferase [bacterium]